MKHWMKGMKEYGHNEIKKRKYDTYNRLNCKLLVWVRFKTVLLFAWFSVGVVLSTTCSTYTTATASTVYVTINIIATCYWYSMIGSHWEQCASTVALHYNINRLFFQGLSLLSALFLASSQKASAVYKASKEVS